MEEVVKLKDESVNLILTDLPYGTIQAKWDSIIPIPEMWEQMNRVITPNGVIALFATQQFAVKLINSNLENYKYEWIWVKSTFGDFVHAKNKPINGHEHILVFSKAPMGHTSLLGDKRMTYNPQGLKRVHKPMTNENKFKGDVMGKRPSHDKPYTQEWCNYPSTVLQYGSDKKRYHPTQKPNELLKFLIKSYTDENDTVLDMTMGSGSTGVACVNTYRNFIGYETNEEYFNKAKQRLEQAKPDVRKNQILF